MNYLVTVVSTTAAVESVATTVAAVESVVGAVVAAPPHAANVAIATIANTFFIIYFYL